MVVVVRPGWAVVVGVVLIGLEVGKEMVRWFVGARDGLGRRAPVPWREVLVLTLWAKGTVGGRSDRGSAPKETLCVRKRSDGVPALWSAAKCFRSLRASISAIAYFRLAELSSRT